MTVGELIDLLREVDPRLPVFIEGKPTAPPRRLLAEQKQRHNFLYLDLSTVPSAA